jgi:hypothetical protein
MGEGNLRGYHDPGPPVVHIVKGRDSFEGRTFQYSYWPGREDEAGFKEQVARNVETGEIATWHPGVSRDMRIIEDDQRPRNIVTVGNKHFKIGEVPGGALPEYSGES